jgi:hypothetical protein
VEGKTRSQIADLNTMCKAGDGIAGELMIERKRARKKQNAPLSVLLGYSPSSRFDRAYRRD